MIIEFDKQIFDISDREQRINYAIAKWNPRINSLASRFSNHVCGKEDLVQEAKLKVVNAADLWNPNHVSGTSWETYAFTAIKNAILEAAVRNKYAMSIPSGSMDSIENMSQMRSSRLPHDVEDFHGDPNEFMEICDTLDEFDHYRVGHMYFVGQETMSEISKSTGISISTISRYIGRMKKLLRTRLAV